MSKKEHELVPELRFPGFEGEWEIDIISNLCEKIIDCVNKTAPTVNYITPYRMIRTTNVRNGKVDLSEINYVEKDTYEKWSRRGKPLLNDLIFTREAPVGEIGVLTDDRNVFLGQRTIMFRVDKNISTEQFVLAAMQTYRSRKQIGDFSNGGTVSHMRVPDCSKIKLWHPELQEQTRIASFLTSVDNRITLLQKKKEALEQYKKGIMQKIFSREIRFKDDQGNDFHDWEEKRLGDVCEIVGGGTPDTVNEDYWNGEIQWFTPTEIKHKYIFRSKRTISIQGLKKSSAKLLPVGTLLLTSRATIADISIVKCECTTNQGFQSLIPNDSYSSEFLYYWIFVNKKVFIRRSSGSTFLEISKKEIQNIDILLPNIMEQRKIADFLSSIDKSIDKVSTQIEASQNWKKGLLQRMFV